VLLAIVALISIVTVPLPHPTPSPSQPAAPPPAAYCAVGETPTFAPAFTNLAQQLGSAIGTPTECSHVDPSSGDTLQATGTGLAYARASAGNTPIFTNGQSHVALTGQGLMGWDGPSVDGPLSLANGDQLPTFCTWEVLAPSVTGFLCAYPAGSYAAWSPPTGAANWVLLGTEPSANASWQLTAAGSAQLGATTAPVSPPPSSDVQVSIDPVSVQPSASFGTISGRVCNQSTQWTAANVQLTFAFFDNLSLPTADQASASVNSVPPDACAPFLTSFSSAFAWQTIALTNTTFTWQRA
jgi:hypothetical protein